VDGIIAMLVGTATGIAVVAAGILTVGVVVGVLAVDVVVVGVGAVVVGVVGAGAVVVGGVVGAGAVVVGGVVGAGVVGVGIVGVGVVGAGAVVVGGGGGGATTTEGSRLNVALTVTGAFPVTVQTAVPEHAPLQPSNLEPEAAVAVSVTSVPGEYVVVQLLPQLIPTGALLTVPVPVPARVMVTL
jgi:hypothetical protein